MNRATFFTTLAGGVLAWPRLARGETADETAIYDLLDAAIDARFTSDFARLVKLLHPWTLGLFRNELAARFDQMLRSVSLEEVMEITGLPAHPKDLRWSDAEFFVAACEAEKERHPDFVGDPKTLPLRIHGTIFDDATYAHVLYSSLGAIHTERTAFDFVLPDLMSVCRVGDQWLVYSCPLVLRMRELWLCDLDKAVTNAGTKETAAR